MQASANRLNCALRPHIKTHKSVEIAKMQLAAGAVGITCAKPSEAEVFADGGVKDIFIAYPLIGENKLRRALNIQKTVNRLITAVDGVDGAKAMSDFAVRNDIAFEARIEIDTGAKRTGACLGKLRAIAEAIKTLPNINVTGVYTFKSMIFQNTATEDVNAAGEEEGRLIGEAAEILRCLGYNIKDVSAGSTPTGLTSAKTGLVNEIRPGTYVFYDWMTQIAGCCAEGDIAAHVLSTVVSAPSEGLAVIDAGAKTLPADVRLNVPPHFFNGFARIAGRDDLILDRLSEEHGMIRSAFGGETGLRVGDTVKLIPSHICTAVNLQDYMYANENGSYRAVKIDARGKVW
jgi:D-serine deaminase-like pyridoxal phosphate-dependent protein